MVIMEELGAAAAMMTLKDRGDTKTERDGMVKLAVVVINLVRY